MKECIPEWHFQRLRRGDKNVDPTEDEFFRGEDLADGVIREGGQNTLDAASNESDEPVRFRLAFHRDDTALPNEKASRYLREIRQHIKVTGEALSDPPDFDGDMGFIVVEDFNTRGLCGDPEQHTDKETEKRNDFYYFFRNVGRSDKSDTDRGRWGLGKSVFPASSRMNSIFALTVREDDQRRLLMGQSTLKIHELSNGHRYSPYGDFGCVDVKHENDKFVLPVEESDFLNRFSEDFKLTREEGDSGLSIVIPFPYEEDLKPEDFARSAIKHYFHPILAEQLVIDIAEAEDTKWTLDHETIERVAEDLDWSDTETNLSELKDLFKFSRWALSCDEDDRVKIAAAGTDGKAPSWEKVFDESDPSDLRERFTSGERIAIRVPVPVKPEGTENIDSYFDVYLQQDEDMDGASEHYIRQGLTISDIRFLRSRPVRGLLIVEDSALSSLLGDSENPSHTKWQPKSKKVRPYEHGYSTVNFVRNGLSKIAGFLTPPPEGLKKDLLADFFAIEVSESDGRAKSDFGETSEDDTRENNESNGGNGNESGNGVGPDVDVDPPQPKAAVDVSKIEGGFKVKSAVGKSAPKQVAVLAAYDTQRGNPFKKYKTFDFNFALGELNIEIHSCKVISRHENELVLEVEAEDFEAVVTGFDEYRDLKVRTRVKGTYA